MKIRKRDATARWASIQGNGRGRRRTVGLRFTRRQPLSGKAAASLLKVTPPSAASPARSPEAEVLGRLRGFVGVGRKRGGDKVRG